MQKLTEIIRRNNLKSLTVLRMEVPCCGGTERIVEQALARAIFPDELRKLIEQGGAGSGGMAVTGYTASGPAAAVR